MRSFRIVLAAGAALALAGVAGVAAAEIKAAHTMTVRLPDGSVEQIRYIGDKPPEVSLQPVGESLAAFSAPPGLPGLAAFADPFAFDPAFAAMQRISADMDRQAAAMLQQARGLQAAAAGGPGGMMQVDLGRSPAGVQGYSMISTLSANGVCTRSVEYTSYGQGQAPKVLTRASGNCGGGKEGPSSAVRIHAVPAPSPSTPGLIQASVHGGSDARLQPAVLHTVGTTD